MIFESPTLVEGSPVKGLVDTYLSAALFMSTTPQDQKIAHGIKALLDAHFDSEIQNACIMFDYIPTQDELKRTFIALNTMNPDGRDFATFSADFMKSLGL